MKYKFMKAIVLLEQSAKLTSCKYIPIPNRIHINLKVKVTTLAIKKKHLNTQCFKNYSSFN